MSLTVNVVDHPDVRVTDEDVGVVSPDAIEFAVEGSITVSPDLLGAFEGRQLRPVAVTVAADDSRVTIDLGDESDLRLESVDVGVETPGVSDFPGPDGVEPTAEGVPGPTDHEAGAVAFTVEGVIAEIDSDSFEALSGEPLRIESVTFAVDEARVTDGGKGDDAVLEVDLLGFHVVVRRDGTVAIGRE